MQVKNKGLFTVLIMPADCLPKSMARQQKMIGEAIRRFRKRARLSQEALAERADLHPVYLGELERGEETASVAALLRIAKAAKVRLRDLVHEL
jgi:DNA-binding XRE family transcriptional regulator